MRLVRIKNKYMFNSDDPYGVHSYGVYYDRKNKRYNAVQLTHLYIKDEDRFKQVRKGQIMVTKFKEFETPSGVRNFHYISNVYGDKIDLNNKDVKFYNNKYLPKKQSSLIKNFASTCYYNGKYYKQAKRKPMTKY